MRLLLFSGSQSPLAVKYPRPSTSVDLPPLVHRALHTALDAVPASADVDAATNTLVIPQPGALAKHVIDSEGEYETTVRIQITSAPTVDGVLAAVRDALCVLGELKGLSSGNVVILGLPEATDLSTWVDIWTAVTSANIPGVTQWGTFNLRQPALDALSAVKPPYADELDIRDCEALPREFVQFATNKGIQLWASGGSTGVDPLPAPELHNILSEFQPRLAVLAPSANTTALKELIPPAADRRAYEDRPAGVRVDWVLSYTLFSRTRNILRDKGYLIAAAFA